MRTYKLNWLKFTITVFASILLSTFISNATEFESAEHVVISNIHVIDGDLYTWGQKVTINGEIKGDLVGGGENVSLDGTILNSANIFSNKFSQSGEINGSLRLFMNDGVIDGSIGRSGLFFCNSLKIGKNAVFGKDVHFRGGSFDFEGVVHGDVTVHSGSTIAIGTGIRVNREGVYISGTIDGDLTIYSNNIHIIPPALIKGDFKYISHNQANIDITSGVTILGNTTWDLPENAEEDEEDSFLLMSIKTGSRFLAAFLFGLILLLIGKKYINAMVHEVQNRFAITAAVGFISLAVLVIFIIILLFALAIFVLGLTLLSEGETAGGTIILALSTLVIPISSVTIATLSTMIYSGKIIVALLLGYMIMKKIKSNPTYLSKGQLFLGLCITYILFAIPYVGTLIFLIVSLVGVGAIILGIKGCHKELGDGKIKDRVGV